MRREYKKEQQSYIDWLKSLGCVFYAPLDQENGFKDLISGVEASTPPMNTQCSINWNQSLGMYEIDNRGGCYAGLMWDGLNMFPNLVDGVSQWKLQDITLLLDCKIITNPGYNYYNVAVGIGGNDDGYNGNVSTGPNRTYGPYIAPYMTFNMRASDAYSTKIGQYVSNMKGAYIKNGSVMSSVDNTTWAQTFYDRFSRRLSLVCACVNNGPRTHFAVSNVYVFNTALDLNTIRKIQGYE